VSEGKRGRAHLGLQDMQSVRSREIFNKTSRAHSSLGDGAGGKESTVESLPGTCSERGVSIINWERCLSITRLGNLGGAEAWGGGINDH